MKRTLIIGMCLALAAGLLAGPAGAKKKKPKPKTPVATPVTFWFHNDSEPAICTDDSAFTLTLTEATSGANCGNRLYGAGYEAGNAAGLVNPYRYNAIEGLPFVLDGTQKITATIQVSSQKGDPANPGALGIGQTTLVVNLSGVSGGETKELGAAEATYTVLPTDVTKEVKFEFEVPAELDKAEFTSLWIDLHNEGMSLNHGYYRTNAPASFIVVPTLQ